MEQSEKIASQMLQLSNSEYLQDDPTRLFEHEDRLAFSDFEGVAINAPKQVATKSGTKVPLVWAARQSAMRDWKVAFEANAILAVSDLVTGSAYFGKLISSPEKEPADPAKSRQMPPPDPEDASTWHTQVEVIDLQNRIGLPENIRRLAVGLLNYDCPSNVVHIDILGRPSVETPSPGPVTPKPNLYSGAAGGAILTQHMPSYVPNEKSPKLTAPGVTFIFEPDQSAGAGLTTHGAFSIVAQQHHIVKTPEIHEFDDGLQYPVAAVVPVTMAIVGLDWRHPKQINLAIPIYSNQTFNAGTVVTGYFSLDLLPKEERNLSPGEYMAYAIVDGNIYGPVPFRR